MFDPLLYGLRCHRCKEILYPTHEEEIKEGTTMLVYGLHSCGRSNSTQSINKRYYPDRVLPELLP